MSTPLHRLRLDSARTRIAIRTRAEGMLSAVAHDLEIVASDAIGAFERGGASWTGSVEVPLASIRVSGAIRNKEIDRAVLSARDRAEIERRMARDVFGGLHSVRIELTGNDVAARLHVHAHRVAEATAEIEQRESEGGLEVRGTANLSLRALGIAEVRGPLGMFRVADVVEVRFDAFLRPE